MRKLMVLILFSLFGRVVTLAQSAYLKGTVIDTTEKKNLPNSVISLIRKSDSVLVGFTRSNANGEFKIKLKRGSYVLLVTYPKFADYVEEITMGDSADIDLDKLILTPKSQLLKEVVVRQKIAAIRIKGDTLEYRADSFAVKPGATVEDLLKKLPGIQVNKNGEITAQGEKVQKVLVDGEEFFSDDPAIVTQNLRADAVKEVQVFDKKSDQATFTGIDDGEKSKTINLTLKDNKKRGYFGKLKLGGGIPGNFENDLMVNAFRGKRKLAAFGTMSNTGKAGLNWQDNEKFGGGSNMQYNEEEGYYFSFNSGDELNTWGGRYSGEGLPTAWTGGVHFSNKWNTDKNNINSNYRYYKQNISITGNTISQYILPDTQYFNNQTRNTYNQNIRHQLNGFYDVQLDSFSSIKFTVSGMNTTALSYANYVGESLNQDSNVVNKNSRLLNSSGEKKNFTSSILWRMKFKKKGRTISLNVDQTYNDNLIDGLLQSQIDYYDAAGINFKQERIDQKKENKNNSLSINSKISYTEPISKDAFLEFNYGYRISNSEALRNSFNKSASPDGKYTERDSLFSNDYDFRFKTHMGGINMRVNKKKVIFSLGSNISHADFRQTDIRKDSSYTYSFVNFFPRATFRYMFGPQRRFGLNYSGSTRQPTLEQLQPIRENNDPLNIQVGNPNLKQEFRSNMSINFNDYKVLSSRSIYLSGNISFIDKAISTSTTVEAGGKRITQYINVNGNYNINMWGGYWYQIKKWKVNIGLNGGSTISKYNNFVNGLRNTNDNRSVDVNFFIDIDKEKKYSIGINPEISRNYTRSSLRPDITTRYWTTESRVNASFFLAGNVELNSDVTFSFREKTSVFDKNTDAIKWNAFAGKKFLKNKTAEIRFSIFDLLNQNIGFERSANSNFIYQNTYNTIPRYWLITFIWNFQNKGAVTTPAEN